jgi:hypothetical protein
MKRPPPPRLNVAGILSFGTRSATPHFQWKFCHKKSVPGRLDVEQLLEGGEEDALKLGGEGTPRVVGSR